MLDRFLRWFWPDHYAETATCERCGAVMSKTSMHHSDSYGYFCNEDEYNEHWWWSQT